VTLSTDIGRPGVRHLAGALGALALAAATLAPGLGASAHTRLERAAPPAKPVGTFVQDFAGDFPTLDPVYWEDLQSAIPMQAIYDTLVTYPLNGSSVVPDLATWTVSPNGLVYTFHLKHGVRFSNGDPVTAQDVVYSLNRVTSWDAGGPKGPAPYGSSYSDIVGYNAWFNNGKKPAANVTGMSGLSAPNPYTVVIHLVQPQAYFLNELALESAAILDPRVVEKYGVINYQLHAVGSGPYKLLYWHQNHQMVLVPNPYYNRANPARIARVVFNVNVPFSTQFLYFKEGKVDMIDLPDQQTYLSALSTPGMMNDFYKQATNEIWYFALNTAQKPFNNLDVRLAVNYAIDRQPDLRLINGLGSVMTQPLPPEMPGYEKNLKGYPYNVALAKKLLAKAGYPHGFTITLVYTTGRPFVQQVSENIQAQLAKIGITVNLKNIAQTGSYFSYTADPKNPFQMAWSDWYQDYPDPQDFLFNLLDSQTIGSLNVAAWSNKAFDALVEKADALPASQEAERIKLYDEAQAIEIQQAPWVPMFYPLQDAFVQPWVAPHDVNVYVHPVRAENIQYMYLTSHFNG
jgi:oligopeptide transport system substrate-binding protein